MKISLDWLNEFVDCGEEIAEVLTTRVAELEGVEKISGDTVFEIDNKSLTHRPDLWGHFGFAREISALLKRPLKLDLDSYTRREIYSPRLDSPVKGRKVTIQCENDCARFGGIEIENVSPLPSPDFIKRRLEVCGVGSKNLLVDLTNYVMLEVGQPLHAYDASLLKTDEIVVRFARDKEAFTGLDGVSRELSTEDVLICDGATPVALAGVIGGLETAVNENTKSIYLESANFDATRIRKTTKRHQLRTDASNRFEKCLSPHAVTLGLLRFFELLLKLAPQARLSRGFLDSFVSLPSDVSVKLPAGYIQNRLGITASDEECFSILGSLGFGVQNKAEIKVPYYRATRDISIADDLVEEVGRIRGYENVPEVSPLLNASSARMPRLRKVERDIRRYLQGAGLSEVYLHSFMSDGDESLTASAVRLENPIDVEFPLLRTTLAPGVIRVLGENLKYRDNVSIFELGRSYQASLTKEETLGSEKNLLAIGIAGEEPFFQVVGVVENLADFFGVGIKREPKVNLVSWMHPYRAASLVVNGKEIGFISETSSQDFLPRRLVVAELDISIFLNQKASLFKPISKFPNSFFEISVVMPKRSYYSELCSILTSKVDKEYFRSIELLDVYEGKPLQEGTKSVSVRLTFGANDHTLLPDELKNFQEKVVESVATNGYSLRT